ncbi:MAG: hypothetical protein NTX87_09360, partial [Planctomycetota bacterium]|nr:hypothetical protein [Planctomycetota bacterium]
PPDMVTQKQLAEAVIVRLREAGHEALLAGGCVRDLLLGRPAKDYDVATSARPEEVLRLFPKALTVGVSFGVVVVADGPLQVEVATFRSDLGYTDGRRPDQVAFTDARHDAARRDFTINGMFLDPAGGEVVDYVGGRKDLEARIIRAVGDPRARFAEDHLRMLRAVRFAAELGFAIDGGTAAAIQELAPKAARVSGERVAMELERLLTAPPEGRRPRRTRPFCPGRTHLYEPAAARPGTRRLHTAPVVGMMVPRQSVSWSGAPSCPREDFPAARCWAAAFRPPRRPRPSRWCPGASSGARPGRRPATS